jgi:hypothetical protein
MARIYRCAGIDVGLTSAHIAFLKSNGLEKILALKRTPDGKRIDPIYLRGVLDMTMPDIVYIENATAMGAGTMSSYHKAAGAIEATVTLCGIDSVYVMPSTWKQYFARHYKLGSDKKASVRLARELFPYLADTYFKHWNTHNAAEAALIALYGGMRCDLVSLQKVAA